MNYVYSRRKPIYAFVRRAEGSVLIVIDGGKGQLHSAINAIHKLGMDIPCISLAKENEEICIPYSSKPIVLPRSNSALKLLQRIRDEAHRFGLAYNVNLRRIK